MMPLVGLGIVRGFSTMFGVPLFEGKFAMPFAGAFLLAGFFMLSRYGMQRNLQGTPGVVEQLMKLQLTNDQGNALSKKQLIKRIAFKWGLLIAPALIGMVIAAIGKGLAVDRIASLGSALVVLLYLIIIL